MVAWTDCGFHSYEDMLATADCVCMDDGTSNTHDMAFDPHECPYVNKSQIVELRLNSLLRKSQRHTDREALHAWEDALTLQGLHRKPTKS